jgi:hypothetical protein
MIKTVQQLREELSDTPDDMRLCVQVTGVSRFLTVQKVVWMNGKCVLVVRDTLSIVAGE